MIIIIVVVEGLVEHLVCLTAGSMGLCQDDVITYDSDADADVDADVDAGADVDAVADDDVDARRLRRSCRAYRCIGKHGSR